MCAHLYKVYYINYVLFSNQNIKLVIETIDWKFCWGYPTCEKMHTHPPTPGKKFSNSCINDNRSRLIWFRIQITDKWKLHTKVQNSYSFQIPYDRHPTKFTERKERHSYKWPLIARHTDSIYRDVRSLMLLFDFKQHLVFRLWNSLTIWGQSWLVFNGFSRVCKVLDVACVAVLGTTRPCISPLLSYSETTVDFSCIAHCRSIWWAT